MKTMLSKTKFGHSFTRILASATLLSLFFTQFSCKKGEDVVAAIIVPHPITAGNISGHIYGTMLAGQTYTVTNDIFVDKDSTLTIQEGVTVIIQVDGDPTSGSFVSKAIHNSGNLYINGSQTSHVVFKPSTVDPKWPNGYWGGIQNDSSAKNVTMTWAEISYTGGPDVVGGAQYAFSVQGVVGKTTGGFSSSTKVIVENCKFTSGIDDCMRLTGPIKVSIKGNVIAHQGSNDGDNINIKSGVTGDVAYNYIWSAANNSIKLNTNKTIVVPETNVNIYNNTLISGGWRKEGETTAGILVDVFAKGSVYNNLIINCHAGIRITSQADYNATSYGYNMFFTSASLPDSVRTSAYPASDWAVAKSTDILNVNPLITNLNTSAAEFSTSQDNLTPVDLNNPHLQATSPAINKANTSAPHNTDLGTVWTPGKDIGAFQIDGSGNKY